MSVMGSRELAAECVQAGALQKEEELAEFLDVLAPFTPLKLAVEIGSDTGGTLWAWTRIAERVISVDLPKGPYSTGRDIHLYGATSIVGNSHAHGTQVRLAHELQGARADLLFIDGDHTYQGCFDDWFNYQHIVKSGGIIAFHDVCEHHAEANVGVRKAWQEVQYKVMPEMWGEIVLGDPTWGGIGWYRKP